MCSPLRKQAFSHIYNISSPKTEIFQIKKNSDIFHISAQNIDCGCLLEPPRRGGSNEFLQSMFLSRNKENNVYPCKPQIYYIKVGFKGSKLYRHVFVMTINTNVMKTMQYPPRPLVNLCGILFLHIKYEPSIRKEPEK